MSRYQVGLTCNSCNGLFEKNIQLLTNHVTYWNPKFFVYSNSNCLSMLSFNLNQRNRSIMRYDIYDKSNTKVISRDLYNVIRS